VEENDRENEPFDFTNWLELPDAQGAQKPNDENCAQQCER